MRLFLAVEPPEALREGVRRLTARLERAHRGWRWVRPDALHLTLRFLGEVSAERDAAARPGWRAAARDVTPFPVRAAGLAAFPRPRRPRVLVVPLAEPGAEERKGGALGRLAHGLEMAARATGFPAETRPFRPHLTIARAARGARASFPSDGGLPEATFTVTHVNLVESTLGPGGARYTVRDVYPLGGCAREDA